MNYRFFLVAAICAVLSACDDSGAVKGQDELFAQVSKGPIGQDADEWIEMRNNAGQWERTGLIFGYIGDRDECEKAIAGLRAANSVREYRCTTANIARQ